MLPYHLLFFFPPLVLILLCFEPVCCWLPPLQLLEPVLAVAVCGYACGRCCRKPLRQICAHVYASLKYFPLINAYWSLSAVTSAHWQMINCLYDKMAVKAG